MPRAEKWRTPAPVYSGWQYRDTVEIALFHTMTGEAHPQARANMSEPEGYRQYT